MIPTQIPAAAESDLPFSRGGGPEGSARGFLIFLAWFCIGVARKIVGMLSSDAGTLTAKGRVRVRRHHSKEIWAQARRDYEEGSFTVPEIAERYGMTEAAVKKRAGTEGWSKTQKVAPPPLLKPADPAQVDAAGASVWARIAHPAQRPPEGEWRTWLFQGGRGAGKTRAGAEWLAARAEASPHGRFALVAATEHDAREVMIEGPSGLRSLPGRERPSYEASRRRLRWKNGAVGYVFSAQEPERLRGPQFEAAVRLWRRHPVG